MRPIDVLRQLQDLDSRIDGARTAITQLRGQLGDRRALDARTAEAAASRAVLHGLEGQQLDLELQAEQRRAKIKADETKLYSGKVTSPKELGSLGEEVAQDKRQLGTVEDRLLEVLQQIEDTGANLERLDALLARETTAWNKAEDALVGRLASAEASLSQGEAQREPLFATVPAPMQSAYQTLRRQKGGVAVAQVHQRTCQACRVGLTPVQEQRARQGVDLVLCNSCGRILFVSLG